MFLRYILTRKKNDLLLKFFEAQVRKPSKGDWSETVQSDIEDLNLNLEFDEIKRYSKN